MLMIEEGGRCAGAAASSKLAERGAGRRVAGSAEAEPERLGAISNV